MRYFSMTLLALCLTACDSNFAQRQWGNAEQIGFEESHEAFSPTIISTGDGTARAAWLRFRPDDLTFHVDVAGYTATNGWDGGMTLGSPPIDRYILITVAGNEHGDSAVFYEQTSGSGGTETVFQLHIAGVGWSEFDFPITPPGSFSEVVGATIDSGGALLVLWRQVTPIPGDQFVVDLYSSAYSRDSGWSPSELIENEPGQVNEAELDTNDDGDAIAVWSQNLANGDSAIFANRLRAGQGWGVAEQISSLPGNTLSPRVTVDSRGHAVAAWIQSDTRGLRISEYDPSEGWETDFRLGPAFRSLRGADLAVDGSDRIFVVWSREREITTPVGLTQDIVSSYRTVAGEWTELLELDNLAVPATTPSIAGLATGGAIVVWLQQHDGQADGVFIRQFSPISGWQEPQVVGQATVRQSSEASPHISTDASGNATVVWTQESRSGGVVVYAARYE